MKRMLLFCCGLLAASITLKAQTTSTINTGMGFGFNLVQYQNDFGTGVNFTSPMFVNKSIGVRLKANLMYHQHTVDSVTTIWSPYGNVSLGLIGIAGNVGDHIRLYGEGGVVGIFPSSNFSSESMSLGGYGVFGFEFFFMPGGNYFIEIGGMGTGAVADRVPNRPIYSNGMTISTGFRFMMK